MIVGILDKVHIVFDDEYGVAHRDKPVEDLDQFLHVFVVETDRRFVEEIGRPLDMLPV